MLYLFLTTVIVPDFVERVDSKMLEMSRTRSTCWTMYLELQCSFRMLNMTKALDEICEEYSRCSVGIGLFVNRYIIKTKRANMKVVTLVKLQLLIPLFVSFSFFFPFLKN